MSLYGAIADHYVAGSAPAVITYRTPTQANALATSININKPTGTATGDLLRVLLYAGGTRTWTVPAGWAVIPGTAAGARMVALYRIADGTEGASFTFTQTGTATGLRAGMVCTTGGNPTTPFDVASFNTASASTMVIPSVTVTTGTHLDSLLLIGTDNATATKPASMTQEFQVNSISTFAGAYETATAGATGTRTWTWDGTAKFAGGLLCALK